MDFLTYHFFDFEFLFRCFLSIFIGGIVGLERELRRKPAGVKTHGLICLGACVLTSLSLSISFFGDPTRIAAQIVTGIGFIGAGTILHSRKVITGLTTAATLWVVTAIGMLIGGGLLVAAIGVTFLVTVLLLGARLLDFRETTLKQYSILIEIKQVELVSTIEHMFEAFDIEVFSKHFKRGKVFTIELVYQTSKLNQHLFMKRLLHFKGIVNIQTL